MTIQALILDWAGTVVDHGSRAPMGAFVRAFAAFGVADTELTTVMPNIANFNTRTLGFMG